MDNNQIRAIFMAHGFTVKEGQTDLKPYVYTAARALLSASKPAAQDRCEICAETEPHTGSCGSTNPSALCNRPAAPAQSGGAGGGFARIRPAWTVQASDEIFLDGRPVTPDEYIAWQCDIIEAVTKAKLPDPKYYGGSAEEGDQHEVKCAYVDGWNECRALILATPQPFQPVEAGEEKS